jgi:hypothetical protein
MVVLKTVCQVPASQSHGSYCSHGRTKPVGSRSPGACLPTQASGSSVQQLLLAWRNQGCWFAPSVTRGAVGALGPAYIGAPVSLAFQGDGSRSYSRGEHGALSSCMCQEAGLTTDPAPSHRATRRLQGLGTGSIEL